MHHSRKDVMELLFDECTLRNRALVDSLYDIVYLFSTSYTPDHESDRGMHIDSSFRYWVIQQFFEEVYFFKKTANTLATKHELKALPISKLFRTNLINCNSIDEKCNRILKNAYVCQSYVPKDTHVTMMI